MPPCFLVIAESVYAFGGSEFSNGEPGQPTPIFHLTNLSPKGRSPQQLEDTDSGTEIVRIGQHEADEQNPLGTASHILAPDAQAFPACGSSSTFFCPGNNNGGQWRRRQVSR